MNKRIYVLGGGAIGLALAANLSRAGRPAVLVRTSRAKVSAGKITITVHNGLGWDAVVETISLAQMPPSDGLMVVAAKSFANASIARTLVEKEAAGPLVVMQNGIGVERSFLDAGFDSVYRCILYVTGQTVSGHAVNFRPVTSSPVGIIRGTSSELEECVDALTTPGFPFHAERNIQRDIWKKTIMNSVFNSICPLLDVDNGIFVRDDEALALARGVVEECAALAKSQGIPLSEAELIESVLQISRGSSGVLISTLQDIRNGRPTEMSSLNLELARIASSAGLALPKTELLGRLTLQKASLALRP